GDDDLVARADPQVGEGEEQRVRPRGDPDREGDAQVAGRLGLERLRLAPQAVLAAREGLEHRAVDLGAQRLVVAARVHHRDRGRGYGWTGPRFCGSLDGLLGLRSRQGEPFYRRGAALDGARPRARLAAGVWGAPDLCIEV